MRLAEVGLGDRRQGGRRRLAQFFLVALETLDQRLDRFLLADAAQDADQYQFLAGGLALLEPAEQVLEGLAAPVCRQGAAQGILHSRAQLLGLGHLLQRRKQRRRRIDRGPYCQKNGQGHLGSVGLLQGRRKDGRGLGGPLLQQQRGRVAARLERRALTGQDAREDLQFVLGILTRPGSAALGKRGLPNTNCQGDHRQRRPCCAVMLHSD